MFAFILLITTLAIAGSAAGFSIYGLANIFGGAFLSVIFMGSSLEAGKLVAVSYLYRNWHETKMWLKTYFMAAILVLMVITSTGIFGYLSAAYQTDTLVLKEVQVQIDLLITEKKELTDRKKEIDNQINSLPSNYITARQRLLGPTGFGPELGRINKRVPELTISLYKLQQEIIKKKVDTGPIAYIAEAFDANIDNATKWIIIMLIIVFDPLAVALTIATNQVYMKNKRHKELPLVDANDDQETKSEIEMSTDVDTNNDPLEEAKSEIEIPTDMRQSMLDTIRSMGPMTDRPPNPTMPIEDNIEPKPTITTVEELEETLEIPKVQEELTTKETQQDDEIQQTLHDLPQTSQKKGRETTVGPPQRRLVKNKE